jgi:hypothetical protein
MEQIMEYIGRLFVAVAMLFYGQLAFAQLNYSTYPSGGSSPTFPDPMVATPLSTGSVNTVNFDWGGGQVLNSGRSDNVIVRFTGYYKVPGTGTQTYYFGVTADDGLRLNINNNIVIDYWGDQGSTFRQGSINLTGGTSVPVELWYYENGGGAVLQWFWWNGSNWEIVDVSNLSTDPTFGGTVTPAPQLCCGGSSVPFNADARFVNRVSGFTNSVVAGDNRVVIQQIGNSGVINVTQSGKKNYVEIISNDNNNITTNQSAVGSNITNYAEIVVNNSNNIIDITQNSSGGTKGILSTIMDTGNILTIKQNGTGNHYAEINLSGGNKTVNLTQSGSAAHMANISLSGGATSLVASQTGSTQQYYSITHNCAQISCSAITVTQGQ